MPMGVSESARILMCTGMTRVPAARARNSSRLGVMVPKSCIAVLLGVGLGARLCAVSLSCRAEVYRYMGFYRCVSLWRILARFRYAR